VINPKELFKATWQDETKASWTIPEDLPYFSGHFPNNPILPAVAILDFTLVGISKILGREAVLKKIKNAKFTDVVRPEHDLVIEFQCIADSDQKKWKVSWTRESTPVATIQLELQG